MRVAGENDTRVKDLQPGSNLSGKEEDAETGGPGGQPEEAALVMAMEAFARGFKRNAAGEQQSGGRPEDAWELDVPPECRGRGTDHEDGDHGAERHGDRGEDDDNGNEREGIELPLTGYGISYAFHFTYYDALTAFWQAGSGDHEYVESR